MTGQFLRGDDESAEKRHSRKGQRNRKRCLDTTHVRFENVRQHVWWKHVVQLRGTDREQFAWIDSGCSFRQDGEQPVYEDRLADGDTEGASNRLEDYAAC